MDNSGDGPLRVPGYGGIPIDFQLPPDDRFAHGFEDFRQTPAITAREMAMVEAMNLITDEPGWHERIFDDDIANAWAKKAADRNKLVGEKAWSWCLAELRDKALEYRQKKFVQVLDMGSCACKSDDLVPESVARYLVTEFSAVFSKQVGSGTVIDAVDPCLYPLVFGETHVLEGGGHVSLSAFSSNDIDCPQASETSHDDKWMILIYDPDKGDFYSKPDLNSRTYQRLPSDFEFTGAGTDARITSYINNVHPSNKSFYENVEHLVSLSVPLWNSCLIRGADSCPDDDPCSSHLLAGDQTQQGRIPLRIISFGAVWKNDCHWSSMYRDDDFIRKSKALTWAKKNLDVSRPKRLKIFGYTLTPKAAFEEFKWIDNLPLLPEDDVEPDPKPRGELKWRHPEPGESFSYDDWKAGKNIEHAVVDMIAQPPGRDRVSLGPTHTRYDIRLEETFKAKGLQVIVQVRSVDVPRPVNMGWSSLWQAEGSLNEHIVATTVYVLAVENVTADVEFRQETLMPPWVYRYENGDGPAFSQSDDPSKIRWRNNDHRNEVKVLAEVFGFHGKESLTQRRGRAADQYQHLGRLALPQGRIVTFSNAVEHKLGVSLERGKSSGHFRYIALHLVDPNYRICSTRNVPPQQHHWWAHAIPDVLRQGGLPQELIDPIHDSSRWSISEGDAMRHRAKMQTERRRLDHERQLRVKQYDF